MWKLNVLAVVCVLTINKATSTPAWPMLQIDRHKSTQTASTIMDDWYSIKVYQIETASQNEQNSGKQNSIDDLLTIVGNSGIIDVMDSKIKTSQPQQNQDINIVNKIENSISFNSSLNETGHPTGQAIVRINETQIDKPVVSIISSKKSNNDSISNMWDETKLFQEEKYSALQFRTSYSYYVQDPNSQVYVTSDVLSDQLYKLVTDSKYSEAVILTEFIYKYENKRGCQEIISKVVNKLVEYTNEYVMNYAYNVFHSYNPAMDCFPNVFKYIFGESDVMFYNANKSGFLTIYGRMNCNINGIDNSNTFKIIPIWALYTTFFSLRNTQTSFVSQFCSAEESADQCSMIHLIPTGFNSDGEILFCLYTQYGRYTKKPNMLFKSYACSSMKNLHEIHSEHVQCSEDVSWIIDQKK